MPVNDFEKQVQQKMDELQFVPADAVWPAVEREIEQKKKRRFIIWLPFLCLLMGGAAWLYFSNNTASSNKQQNEISAASTAAGSKLPNDADAKQTNPAGNQNKIAGQPVAAEENAAAKKGTAKNIPEDITVDKNKSANTLQNIADKIAVATIRNKKILAENGNDAGNNNDKIAAVSVAKSINHPNKKSKHINGSKSAITKNTSRIVADDNAVDEEQTTSTVNKNDIADTTAGIMEDKKLAEEKSVVAVPPAGSMAAGNALAVKEAVDTIQKSDSSKAIAKNKNTAKAKKIEWGASVHAGVSNISNGFSGIFSGAQTLDARSFSSLQANPSNLNNSNNGAQAVAPPSDVHAGFSYGFGLAVSVPLGKGFSLLTGLNYNYYSTVMQVGAKIDTGVNAGQYRTGSASKYTNKFHFIELPVTVQKQLGKKSRFAVNGGLSLSVLAASKLLLYDAQKINYGSGKSYINKLQLNVTGGVSYQLFPKMLPIEIGPQFSYGISNIYNKEVYGSRHLFFAGLNARVFFRKK